MRMMFHIVFRIVLLDMGVHTIRQTGMLAIIDRFCAVVGKLLVKMRCLDIAVFNVDPVCCCYGEEEVLSAMHVVILLGSKWTWGIIFHLGQRIGLFAWLFPKNMTFVPVSHGEGDELNIGWQFVVGDLCEDFSVIKEIELVIV